MPSEFGTAGQAGQWHPFLSICSATRPPGVISLIFGCIAIVCLILGCCTLGITFYAAVPFATVGAIYGFFARGNLRVAGLVLNLLTLVPAIIVIVLFLMGIGMDSIREIK